MYAVVWVLIKNVAGLPYLLYWFSPLSSNSLLVDVDHAESGSLIRFSLVLDCEDHDLVAGEAVSLFFGNLQY